MENDKGKFNLDKRILFASMALVCIIILSFTLNGKTSMTTYKWRPTESAKAQFPMEIIEGDLFYPSGSIYIPDNRTVKNGWGEMGSTHVAGEDMKGIPHKLSITWFSYLEDTFYSGEIDLPSEKISEMFETGVINKANDKPTTYDTIVVGMGLGGEVAVWMNGAGVVTEVGQYSVPVADIPWERVLDNPDVSKEAFIQMVLLESLGENGINASRKKVAINNYWERYKRKYNWALDIEGTVKPLRAYLKNLNGEQEYINLLKQIDQVTLNRAVPESISIDFQSQNARTFNVKFQFDEDEMVAIYEKLHAKDPNSNMYLRIEIEDETKHAAAYVLNDEYKVSVQKSTLSLSAY